MDIVGLETFRQNLGLRPKVFAKALVAAEAKVRAFTVRELDLDDMAIIYAACADAVYNEVNKAA